MHRLGAFLVGAAVLGTAATALAADDPAYLTIGAGGWQVLRGDYTAGEVDIGYQSSYKLWILKPHAGVLIATDGDYYAYAGLLTDLYWGKHIVTTLSTAVGGYGGNGYDLGSHVEFRSGINVAWRFQDTSRLGVALYHISNAGITDRNPGSESVMLTYAMPVGKILRLFGGDGGSASSSSSSSWSGRPSSIAATNFYDAAPTSPTEPVTSASTSYSSTSYASAPAASGGIAMTQFSAGNSARTERAGGGASYWSQGPVTQFSAGAR